MINTMNIDGYKAVIQYDSEIDMFRGEFVGINGGADFYGKDVDSLKEEGKTTGTENIQSFFAVLSTQMKNWRSI